MSYVENYVVCVLALTIYPCRNIWVFFKSLNWIFQGPLVWMAEIFMNFMANHSICNTISYSPNIFTAKTMDGLISSHYSFHSKLGMSSCYMTNWFQTQCHLDGKAPMKHSHKVLHAHFPSHASQSQLLFSLLPWRNAEYFLLSETSSMTAKRRP